MGGSLGLALKQRQVCREVVGLVRRSEVIAQAEAMGAVDWATTDPQQALAGADLVVLAAPIRTIIEQIGEFAPFYKPGAIITDMGSTKQAIIQAMDTLPVGLQPIGSHPMCGKERAGLDVAEATLFEGAPWILTPLPRTAFQTLETVQALAEAIGSRIYILEPTRHDRLVATISHLPYMLSVALVATAQEIAAEDPTVWDVAASGFRDTSRLAASNVTMMMDIILTNQAALGQLMGLFRKHLDELATALAEGDEAMLRTMLDRITQQRNTLYR
jgi:prephenate dehydrogenase